MVQTLQTKIQHLESTLKKHLSNRAQDSAKPIDVDKVAVEADATLISAKALDPLKVCH